MTKQINLEEGHHLKTILSGCILITCLTSGFAKAQSYTFADFTVDPSNTVTGTLGSNSFTLTQSVGFSTGGGIFNPVKTVLREYLPEWVVQSDGNQVEKLDFQIVTDGISSNATTLKLTFDTPVTDLLLNYQGLDYTKVFFYNGDYEAVPITVLADLSTLGNQAAIIGVNGLSDLDPISFGRTSVSGPVKLAGTSSTFYFEYYFNDGNGNLSTTDGQGFGLTVLTVPEPSSALLVVLGSWVGLLRRRR